MSYYDYLEHHGIKGMHWGIRRFQNTDGSLTGAGRKRYGVLDKTREKISGAVSRHKEKQLKQAKALEDAYVSKGMSREKAAKKVETRRKIERALMIAGAVAVTAAVGTYAYRKYQGQVDHILKQGTSIQRIEFSDEGKLHNNFYAAINKHDKTRYAGLLGKTRQMQFGNAYKMGINVNQDTKVAGNKAAFKTFKQLYENDEDFRWIVNSEHHKRAFGGGNAVGKGDEIWSLYRDGKLGEKSFKGKDLKKLYENFNTNIVDEGIARNNVHGRSGYNKFQEALQKQGYGGFLDINDQKFSGYNAHAPAILFDSGKEFTVKSFEKMGNQEIDKALKKTMFDAEATSRLLAATGLFGLGMMKSHDINAINEAKLKANKKTTNGGSRNVRKKKRR